MFKIGTYLPEKILFNEELEHLGWSPKKIFIRTGIKARHISADSETALDLAEGASENLFLKYNIDRDTIDYVLYCTQSPDYALPNNVGLLHERLGLKKEIPSLEFNQGCSGYIYGLSMGKALINTNLANNILFVTTDTYSKDVDDNDRTTKTIFGDGATATLITREEVDMIGEFVFGTDGNGAKNLCMNNSGFSTKPLTNSGFQDKLFMNGGEIFNFVLKRVPVTIEEVLMKNSLSPRDIDHFVFHQANNYVLNHLGKKLEIPNDKFPKFMEMIGNTGSSSIPFLVNNMNENSAIKKGDIVLLIAFGIGYSWGSTIVRY